MAIQTVFVGTTPGDDTGDPARTCFIKINDNFTQPENAASRLVGTAAGNVMLVGAFGIGSDTVLPQVEDYDAESQSPAKIFVASTTATPSPGIGERAVLNLTYNVAPNQYRGAQLSCRSTLNEFDMRSVNELGNANWVRLRHTGNTTVDGNGFIKVASPIVSLYRDRAESNGYAELEEMQFERIATGHYRLTGVPELSRDGWYIETPKDRNGNVYFTIDYTESEGQLDIRTYTPDYSTGRAENGAPVDIIDGRFVSLRFAASPETAE